LQKGAHRTGVAGVLSETRGRGAAAECNESRQVVAQVRIKDRSGQDNLAVCFKWQRSREAT